MVIRWDHYLSLSSICLFSTLFTLFISSIIGSWVSGGTIICLYLLYVSSRHYLFIISHGYQVGPLSVFILFMSLLDTIYSLYLFDHWVMGIRLDIILLVSSCLFSTLLTLFISSIICHGQIQVSVSGGTIICLYLLYVSSRHYLLYN